MADLGLMQEMRENIIQIKMNMDKFIETESLKMQIIDEKLKVANNRIADLEETNKWMWRTIIGSIICAIMALILKV